MASRVPARSHSPYISTGSSAPSSGRCQQRWQEDDTYRERSGLVRDDPCPRPWIENKFRLLHNSSCLCTPMWTTVVGAHRFGQQLLVHTVIDNSCLCTQTWTTVVGAHRFGQQLLVHTVIDNSCLCTQTWTTVVGAHRFGQQLLVHTVIDNSCWCS